MIEFITVWGRLDPFDEESINNYNKYRPKKLIFYLEDDSDTEIYQHNVQTKLANLTGTLVILKSCDESVLKKFTI